MGEWTVILLIGVMIYGRRLPEVGRQLGRTVAKMRRGFDEFRRELDRDEHLRDVRSSMRDVRSALDAPRRALDPRRYIEDAIRVSDTSTSQAEEPAVPDPNAPIGPGEPDRPPGVFEETPTAEPAEEARRAAIPGEPPPSAPA